MDCTILKIRSEELRQSHRPCVRDDRLDIEDKEECDNVEGREVDFTLLVEEAEQEADIVGTSGASGVMLRDRPRSLDIDPAT